MNEYLTTIWTFLKLIYPKSKQYVMRNLIAIDQLINTLIGGHPDETMSAACWRKRAKFPFNVFRFLIDCLFFVFERRHCEASYISEMDRNHLPDIYKGDE